MTHLRSDGWTSTLEKGQTDKFTFSNVAGWRCSGEGNTLLSVGCREVVHVVPFSEPSRNENWRALRFVLKYCETTFQLHLRGEGDVVVQKLTVLQKEVFNTGWFFLTVPTQKFLSTRKTKVYKLFQWEQF